MVERIRAVVAAGMRPEFWRAHLEAIAYITFGVVLFMVFLASNFPYGPVLTSTFNRFNLIFTYRSQRASLPMGAMLMNARLADPYGPGAPALLDNVDVRLSPAMRFLAIGRPGIDISAALYGGSLDATVYRKSGFLDLTMDASDLELSRYQGLARFGMKAAGKVSASGSATLSLDDWTNDRANLRVGAVAIDLRIARGLPAIRLARLTGTASLNESVVKIDNIEGSGGDLSLRVTGTIRLAADPSQSFIDLKVNIRPTAAGHDHLAILLGMLPHPPGAEPYLIRGPLTAPSIS
jgi:type II secretion system protein N